MKFAEAFQDWVEEEVSPGADETIKCQPTAAELLVELGRQAASCMQFCVPARP